MASTENKAGKDGKMELINISQTSGIEQQFQPHYPVKNCDRIYEQPFCAMQDSAKGCWSFNLGPASTNFMQDGLCAEPGPAISLPPEVCKVWEEWENGVMNEWGSDVKIQGDESVANVFLSKNIENVHEDGVSVMVWNGFGWLQRTVRKAQEVKCKINHCKHNREYMEEWWVVLEDLGRLSMMISSSNL
ncbi:hypothetical protein L208DRAFT_1551535 [Tricholoma matsutake]|nr:hypothetical protein L208DRAFT_1551535 [Tricholoma matsutake 945]